MTRYVHQEMNNNTKMSNRNSKVFLTLYTITTCSSFYYNVDTLFEYLNKYFRDKFKLKTLPFRAKFVLFWPFRNIKRHQETWRG